LTFTFAVYLFSNKEYGHEFFIVGSAAYYNKIGFVLLSIIFVLALVKKDGAASNNNWTFVGIGLALGISFVVKASFFVIAIPSVIVGLLLAGGPSVKKRALGLAVIVLTCLVAVGALGLATGQSLSAYLADLATAAEARSFATPLGVIEFLTRWYFLVCFVLVLAVVMYLLPQDDRSKLIQMLGLSILGLATLAMLQMTNSQPVDFQFLCTLFATLCSISVGGRPLIGEASGLRGLHGSVVRSFYVALLSIPFAVVITTSALGEIYARSLTVIANRFPEQAMVIPTRAMAGWKGVGLREGEVDYVSAVQAGVQVLSEIAKPGDTVQVLDFSNPFSFALGLPPPKGGALWWHATFNMSPERLIILARGVTAACIVMYPHIAYVPIGRDLLFSAVKQDLDVNFYIIHQDEYWNIFMNRRCR
jgi:hypothetical protein